MKVLHLTLKKKWFDMEDSGEKPEEYREIKPYWIRRLVDINAPEEWKGENKSVPFDIAYDILYGHNPQDVLKAYYSKLRGFDIVEAKNGYSKTSPKWRRKFIELTIDYGKPEWGAEPGKLYFVIKLGEKFNQPNQ